MSGDTTYQALKRLSFLPNRDDSDNGSVLAGQEYDDVYIIGGEVNNVVMDAPTIADPAISGGTIDGATITNSTFSGLVVDSNFTIQDDVDPTKEMQFQLSGIPTMTDVVLSVPPASTTIVGTDSTQALTNKTYNGLTVTPTTGTLTIADGTTASLNLTGALSLLGNDALTLNTSASTNITLPTTGTVATIDGNLPFVNIATPSVQAANSSGLSLLNSAGTPVLTLGPAVTTNATFAGAVNMGSIGTLTTPLSAANGGTGQSSYAVGDILYASGATALSKLAGVATGNALISGGVSTAPSWGKIGLTTHVSGVLPTANGGTNLSSFTSGGAVYATSTSALTTGTLPVASGGTGATSLTSNNVILGNGTSAVQFVAPGTSGNVLTSNGTTWTSATPTAIGSPTSWTPTLTFQTPGDLSVTYSLQAGTYIKIGRLVIAWFTLATSAFTYTTASGIFRVGGLPFAISNSHEMHMPLGAFAGITKANYTQFECRMTNGTSYLDILASGSGQVLATVSITDAASGTNKTIYGCVMYTAAS